MASNEVSIILSKIRTLEPENAPKITGYILMTNTEADLKILAYGPDHCLQHKIFEAKTHVGISQNTLSATPNSPSLLQENRSFSETLRTLSNEHSWPIQGYGNKGDGGSSSSSISPYSNPLLSSDYSRAASVFLPSFPKSEDDNVSGGSASNGNNNNNNGGGDILDEYQWGDFFSFLDDSSPRKKDILECRGQLGSYGVSDGESHLHERLFSLPCKYFAASGFCRNGKNCTFIHGGNGCDSSAEMVRMKAVLQQQQNYPAERLGPEMNELLAMEPTEMVYAARQIFLTFPADSTVKFEDISNYFSSFGPVQNVRIRNYQERLLVFVKFVRPEAVRRILITGNPHFICDSRVFVKPYKKRKVANHSRRPLCLQQQAFESRSFPPRSSPLSHMELYNQHVGARMFENMQEVMLRRTYEEQSELQRAIEIQGRRLNNLQLPDFRGDYASRQQRRWSVGAPFSLHSPDFMGDYASHQQRRWSVGAPFSLHSPDFRGDYASHQQRRWSVGAPFSLHSHSPIEQNVILHSERVNNQETPEDNSGNSVATVSVSAEKNNYHEASVDFQKNGNVNERGEFP